MADWRVIENCGRTLATLIERHLARLGIANVDCGVVTTAAFPALASAANPFISLFLFQIGCNAEMRNLPQSILPDGTPVRQPLPLELGYLVTAWGVRQPNDPDSDALAAREEARLLGVVMQALYDAGEIARADLFELAGNPVWEPLDGLQVSLQSLPVDTHYRIWDASELGYRLSLVYRVRVASLAPILPPPTPPVASADLEMV